MLADENNFPLWYQVAQMELGTAETPGRGDNEAVLKYWGALNRRVTDDEVPWCSAFAAYCCMLAGEDIVGVTPAARSWLKWGIELNGPLTGCIVVLKRGSQPWQGHVGFLAARSRGTLTLLGGNQSDSVSLAPYRPDQVLGYRWSYHEPIRRGK